MLLPAQRSLPSHALLPLAATPLIRAALWLCLFALMFGCSVDPETIYDEGSKLAQSGDYQAALERFKHLGSLEVADEHKYRSLYGQSQVFQRLGDLEKQSAILDEILKDSRFSRYHQVVHEDLEENLLSRAKIEKSKPDPRDALAMYRRALELNPKSEARAHLTEFLRAQGDEAVTDRRLDEALKTYQEVRALNATDELMTSALNRKIEQVKLIQYRFKVAPTFTPKLMELTRSKLYDPKTKTFYFKVESYAVGRVTRKNQAEQEQLARAAAELLALHEVSQRVQAWFSLPKAPQVNEALISFTKGEFERRTKRIKLEGRSTRVTPFYYYFSLSIDAVYQLAFQVDAQSKESAGESTTEGAVETEQK